MSMPFPDALQEFKVETSATRAQNGMKSCGFGEPGDEVGHESSFTATC